MVATIPELGPLLPRLVAPPDADAELPGFPAVRLGFASALFERAGVARDLLANGDVEGARVALGRQGWLSAWRASVDRAADQVITVERERLERSARESLYPARRLPEPASGTAAADRIRARLDSAGIPLEDAAARLQDPGRGDWAAALHRVAIAAEESWLGLERIAREELGSSGIVAERVRQWRRPRGPLWLISGLFVGASGAAGLMLGGYLPVPAVLRPLVDWWWSLPWP